MSQTAATPAHALHGHSVAGMHEDVTYHLPAGAIHFTKSDQYGEWEAAAKAAGATLDYIQSYGVGYWRAKDAEGRIVGAWKCGFCAHGHLMTQG